MLTLSSVFIGVWFVILTAVNSPVYALDHLLGEQCSLYIAASTIPAAGLGFFTGIERQAGAVLGYGDVMIPLSDQVYHFQALGSDAWQRSDWNFVDPTADYLWYGPELGMHRESAHPQAQYEFALGTLKIEIGQLPRF